MIEICHDQVLRNECQIGEGIFVSMKEMYRKGKTCDHILRTHEDYINNHVTVSLWGVDLRDLEEPATKELCQSVLIHTLMLATMILLNLTS